MSNSHPRRALVSVSDKSGLDVFVKGLAELGFEFISTGGTRRYLEEQGVNVIDISEYTGFPEIMDGRVKTLHPKVHGAILGRPDLPGDAAAIEEFEIVPFELVVCNLYPFEATIAKPDVTLAEAIEQIDIGGPSMVRSAAKNHAYVGIVTSEGQYSRVLEALQAGPLTPEFRLELSAAAFEMTACYDRAVSNYMSSVLPAQEGADSRFAEQMSINLVRRDQLRYGENPHQSAAFYVEKHPPAASVANAEQLNGKELSYNNFLDLDAALQIASDFDAPAAVVIKHTNPCGCATADSLAEAFEKAYAGDPVSAFGSIMSFNRPVDRETAEKLCEPNRFIEAIIAPDYEPEAFELLTTKPKWKKNVRLMKCPMMTPSEVASLDYRRVSGGLLVQERDELRDDSTDWKVVTKREPTSEELHDLSFGWIVCRHVKSNAIILAKDEMLLGAGAGQMSRLDSSYIAAYKAGDRSKGAIVASDAFFPFRDGIDEAAKAGVTAIIQPGGSVRDEEVIEACNEHQIAMIFTGRRHFKH
ncbi:bifunctional phosphoribosylaminoimidazolecarboxamide formyltransferase/IMP cyclohydrolase [Gimesia fumaroli]|uniref:Bifunctional purine biosynthesis protein PurH n=1 Tax=Gimesia fumaroli TaxID=2527976 RepID=A0A518IEA4_9PLAN|nr:bifunctional phosphoribosylaminoimidazolecarboxamide formyltransferase/IMP cyclohydrolase [Gimesia fumaroli]QDV51419.1 Bifunctional purine biosynthesis protein PurH [Gimesia fumaroli]